MAYKMSTIFYLIGALITVIPSLLIGKDGQVAAVLQCHQDANDSGLVNDTQVELIDQSLDSLYDAIWKKNATLGEECTFSVSFENEDKELVVLLESFEILRNQYAKGYWGYCGQEGAENLISRIEALTNQSTVHNYTLCDLSKVYGCNEKWKKCGCFVDDHNFRHIESESVNGSKCYLVDGSHCPFLPHTSDATCHPDLKCLYESDDKECRPRAGMSAPPLNVNTNLNSTPPYRIRNVINLIQNRYCKCSHTRSSAGGPRGSDEVIVVNLILSILLGCGHLFTTMRK